MKQPLADFALVVDKLGKGNLAQHLFDGFVEYLKHRADAAVSVVDTDFLDARETFAMFPEVGMLKNADDLADIDLVGWTGQHVAALDTARRLDNAGVAQQPENFPGIGRGNTFPLANLLEGQPLSLRLAGKLDKASKAVFFLSCDSHQCETLLVI